ncbi:hypothetical protein DMC47_13105 [Nostoc sp. 3335mG]|nr:hypothetical protein DMC47_13105 [Nostoc sp. 3335mG]
MGLIYTRSAVLLLAALVAGCGGGSGSVSNPSGNVAPAPTPTPTSTSTAAVFAAGGTGPLMGTIAFDANGNGFAEASETFAVTDQSGRAGSAITGLAAGNGSVPTGADARLLASGGDGATGFFVGGLTAPKGATVISPLTTLIDKVGDQALVRQALGLSTGRFPVRATTDLLTFPAAQRLGDADPAVAADAAAITAVNFRLLALLQVASRLPVSPDDSSSLGPEAWGWMADYIRSARNADFTDRNFVESLLNEARSSSYYGPEAARTAAQLFVRFMRITPTTMADAATVYRYTLGFRFFAQANINAAFSGSPATGLDRLNAITDADMSAAVARFADTPRPVVDGQPYALPDYIETNGRGDFAAERFLRNDAGRVPWTTRNVPKALTGISVDPRFAGIVSVVRSDGGGVTVIPAGGYIGPVWFDYTARIDDVATTARVHVNISR